MVDAGDIIASLDEGMLQLGMAQGRYLAQQGACLRRFGLPEGGGKALRGIGVSFSKKINTQKVDIANAYNTLTPEAVLREINSECEKKKRGGGDCGRQVPPVAR